MEEKIKKEIISVQARKEEAVRQVQNWTAQVNACNGALETLEKLLKKEIKQEAAEV